MHARSVPTDTHRKRSLGPVSPLNDRQFPFGVGTRPIEYVMRVSVFYGIEVVGVSAEPIVRV